MNKNIKHQLFHYDVKSYDEQDINGSKIGIVRGYLAAFSRDRGDDIISKGAFDRTIKEHKARGDRPIRMFFQHDPNQVIGGFPLDLAYEDENGLFGEGHINLEVQKGREAYALAKQGVITDFSIGYMPTDFEYIKDSTNPSKTIRVIKGLDLIEVSLVSEPMNIEAMMTEVKKFYTKTATEYKNLPIAPRDHEWEADAADMRVREFTNSQEKPSESYKNAFMWYDAENENEYGAYKLPYADVINGDLYAVPNAIIAIAAALEGARGGVDLPEDDRPRIISNVNKYYEKMEMPSPIDGKGVGIEIEIDDESSAEEEMPGEEMVVQQEDNVKSYIDYNMLMSSNFSKRDLERALKSSKCFSIKASATLASVLDILRCDTKNFESKAMVDIKQDIDCIKKLINKW